MAATRVLHLCCDAASLPHLVDSPKGREILTRNALNRESPARGFSAYSAGRHRAVGERERSRNAQPNRLIITDMRESGAVAYHRVGARFGFSSSTGVSPKSGSSRSENMTSAGSSTCRGEYRSNNSFAVCISSDLFSGGG